MGLTDFTKLAVGGVLMLLVAVLCLAVGDAFAERDMATWSVLATFLAGVAALGQAAFAMIALRSLQYGRDAAIAASGALEHQRETAERQLRAYFGLDELALTLVASERASVDMRFVNSGATPVISARTRSALIWLERGEPRPDFLSILESERWIQSGSVLPGKAFRFITSTPDKAPDNAKQLMKEEGLRLLLYGEVEYVDAFEKVRISTVSLMTDETVEFGTIHAQPDLMT